MTTLLDKILDRQNMYQALKRVCSNKGTSGVDGITIDEIDEYIRENWQRMKVEIKERRYKPQPVLRVEIPKPNGGIRGLGIPTVMDRIIQQAMVQILSPIADKEFSEFSYGFRLGRSCEMAVVKLMEYFNDGYVWVVDIDLEKFFDTVPQDKLMSLIHNIINDPDTESLIRKFLQAGIMNKGEYQPSKTGTPQGGNLSPLLSNIMLNELDKELENRGLNFVRYADDCVITVKSEAAAKRVMQSVTSWIERKLGLKVNANKSKITRPNNLKYLGFGFWKDGRADRWKARPHQDSIKSFKEKLIRLTQRKWSISFTERLKKLNQVIRGWINYFLIGSMKSVLTEIDSRLRTRLRMIIWKMWKVPTKRQWGLQKLGINIDLARLTSYCGDRYYFVATKTCVVRAISKDILVQRGLVSPLDYYIHRRNVRFN
ncbi:MAG: group II intron reverse transcriptase/maturase [Tissierellia bacterium]|nr:group II intron reverse transcriptase/maturase [Tissierellia bacterium]